MIVSLAVKCTFLLYFVNVVVSTDILVEVPRLPQEILEDLSASHPRMRQLLADTNSTTNNTCIGGKPWRPACGELQPVGQYLVCVSNEEYVSAATSDANSDQYTDGTFFCDGHVDYAAACDLKDNQTTCNNAFATKMFENFKRALSVYSCKSYSKIWTCDDCAAAYKRWLCSQVYKKFYIPDTGYYEEGIVPQSSRSCTCEASETIEPCKRFCNGMPNDCFINENKQWQCSREACGRVPGNCRGHIMLGANASSTSGFYKGAKIEIIESGAAKGQWAEIEEYYAFSHTASPGEPVINGIAMFKTWKLPWSPTSGSGVIQPPKALDVYRIYWEADQRGHCRLSARPQVRKGLPCESRPQYKPMDPLYDPQERQTAEALAQANLANLSAFKNLTYCGEDQQCVAVAAAVSPSGYLCCPNSGMRIVEVEPGQQFTVSYLNLTDPARPMCWAAQGDNYTAAMDAVASPDAAAMRAAGAAPLKALGAVAASGCTSNFTTISDRVVDDCVLRTCQPVCYDVSRRCPQEFEFACPDIADNREYDSVLCNMVVSQGCTLSLSKKAELRKKCAHLNPGGYGPQNDSREKSSGVWLMGSEILGLPQPVSCQNLSTQLAIDVGLRNPPADGPSDVAKGVWCTGTALDAEGLRGLTRHGQETNGAGCIETRYMGAYMAWCAQAWDPALVRYYDANDP